ncbi:DUF1367 family protein [Rhizobium leguminosarum]|uniref:DUF1367 family protein n=1 Tax=Rhizobium leguminosarum TaxID=384 RepID=UPI001C965625|nr:DUF1367 family protein [Rhizobium leguminosarum]MBY5821441.1 DUF1367 family protein [Rhizobium leguminosarum]
MAKKSETPPIYCLKRGETLVGEMQLDRERIAAMPAGERIRVELRTGRVPSRLRFWWAFLHEVVSSTECCPTAEALHETVKLMCGYTTPVLVKGMTVMVPRSIAFSSMTEEEFTKFLADGLRFIADNYGVTPEQAGVAA